MLQEQPCSDIRNFWKRHVFVPVGKHNLSLMILLACTLFAIRHTATKYYATMSYSPQVNSKYVSDQCVGVMEFPGTVILGRPTGNEITFNFLSSENFEAYIDAKSETYDSFNVVGDIFVVRAGIPTTVELSGLLPNSHYLYTVVRTSSDGALFCTRSGSFQTQRSADSSFRFAIVADSHLGTPHHCEVPRYSQTLFNVHQGSPDFVISLGDDFRASMIKEPVTAASVEELYRNQRPFFSIFSQDAPLFNVNGNHELQSGWLVDGTDQNVAAWAIKSRLAHFPNPRPNYFYSGNTLFHQYIPQGLVENYYAFVWGPAFFVILDDYLYSQAEYGWPVTLGYEQYNWLKGILQSPSARYAKYRFVFHHHISGSDRGGIELAENYEWGGYTPKTETFPVKSWDFEKMRPGWGNKPIHQILVENNVNVVFQGHDHLYTKQDHPDGIVYVTVPFPGYNPTSFWGGKYDNSPNFHSGTVLAPPGNLLVDVSPTMATITYVMSRIPGDDYQNGINGETAHSFTLYA